MREQTARTERIVELGAVGTVFVIGVALRAWHLGRAARYDEAYTYLQFASHPLWHALSDYRAPNNHLLHTLLVHFSTELFGNTYFGLRFPAFVAGCLTIPAAWLVARSLYDPLTGILTAGCVAGLPTFIEFSVNARGYSLQWLCILATIWCAARLNETRSQRTVWLGLVVAGSAGIYAIPTMVLPLAGIFLWMLASCLASGKRSALPALAWKLGQASLAILLVSAILYLPPLLIAGPRAVLSQGMAALQQESFEYGLRLMLRSAWVHWTDSAPAVVVWILVCGLAVGFVFHRRAGRQRLPLLIVLLLTAVIFVWLHHVYAFPRMWSYLLSVAVMTACAGLSLALRWLAGGSGVTQRVLAGATAVALAVSLSVGMLRQRAVFDNNETGALMDVDEILHVLTSDLHPGDALIGEGTARPILQYELLRQDPHLYESLRKPTEARRVFVVLPKPATEDETWTARELRRRLARENAADPSTIGPRIASDVALGEFTTPKLVASCLSASVYLLERQTTAN